MTISSESAVTDELFARVARAEQGRQRRAVASNVLRNGAFMSGSIILMVIVLTGIFGPFFVADPLFVNPIERLQGPSFAHPFGTDGFGRDVFSRVVHGAQISVTIGTGVTAIAGLLGLAIGLYSAFYPRADGILMRICDALMAFPAILLAISITAALGPATGNVVISLAFVFTPIVARVVRAATLSIKQQMYVDALRSQGAGSFRMLWINVLPNVISPLIVQATFIFADSLIVEAALSFLGAGVPAPAPSWGNMLLEGKSVLFEAWWLVAFPGLAIMLTVLSANLLGDGLRDILDPHQKAVRPVLGFIPRKKSAR